MRRERNRKRREKRRRARDGCTGKKRYPTPQAATSDAEMLIRTRPSVRKAGVYLCPKGGAHYHVTSKPGPACVVLLEQENEA